MVIFGDILNDQVKRVKILAYEIFTYRHEAYKMNFQKMVFLRSYQCIYANEMRSNVKYAKFG